MRTLTVGSLFSGIGGFDLGFERAGFEIKWQVEIDPFCRAVLAKHWPLVRRYEDVRTVGSELERVDVIAGGFPCQDLSSAGKRAGLSGARSGLYQEFIRIIAECRKDRIVADSIRVPGCRDCQQVTSGDCGNHEPVVYPLTGSAYLGVDRDGWEARAEVAEARLHALTEEHHAIRCALGTTNTTGSLAVIAGLQAQVAAITQQHEAAELRIAELCDAHEAQFIRADSAEGEVLVLRRALLRYGRHEMACAAWLPVLGCDESKCICGFRDALRASEPTP